MCFYEGGHTEARLFDTHPQSYALDSTTIRRHDKGGDYFFGGIALFAAKAAL